MEIIKRAAGQSRLLFLVLGVLFAGSFCTADEKPDSTFEITGHRVRLQLFPSLNGISCIDTVTIRQTARHERIDLKFVPVYDIGMLTINGKKKDFKKINDLLEIEGIPDDSVFQSVITYSGTLSFHSEFSQMTNDRAVLREEEILPSGPRILRYVRMSIVVPAAWDVVTAGRLVERDSLRDSTTYVWESNEPIPMIGWICAGIYPVHRQSSDPSPVSVHLFQEDSASAPNVLSLARHVLAFYGQKFLPYRFPKLAIVEVEDWVAGRNVLAIAVPSMIMVKKLAFTTDDKFNRFEAILPHEVAHQWWPMTVFLKDEDAAFLAEGLCEYCALLYNESEGTLSARDSLSHHPLLRSLVMRVQQGRDLPMHQKADLRSLPTHYLKGSYTHNMLRRMIGDSLFFELLHQLTVRFTGKRIGLDEFQHLAEGLSGMKLGWFFDQWVRQRGLPQLKLYNVKSVAQGRQWLTRGRVRMVGYAKYTSLVNVGVQTPGGMKKTSVRIGADSAGSYHNDMPFELFTDEKPLRAILDPGGDVLKIEKLPPKFTDLHDPSNGVMIVGSLRDNEYLLGLARKDSMAMERAWWSISIKLDTNITLADLQSERVFLYGRASQNRVVADLEKKFPLGFHGDSVAVKGETIFDSTLALMQCIDNPYIAQGILCWVAPFTTAAQPELLPIDHSWAILRGKDEIASGNWEVKDEDLVVEIKQ
jgi:hypothetical protein